jgi:hypothetical protein
VKKRAFWIGLTAAAILGSSISCFAVDDGKPGKIQSKNTVKYQSVEGTVEIYSSDIQLLADKVDSISPKAFESANYTHAHSWSYINVTGDTHTKHCLFCDSAYDITVKHSEAENLDYSISYNEKTYEGYQYTCECGYQWIVETGHNYVYDYVDEKEHSYSCALNGTDYCEGFAACNEEHFPNTVTPDDTGDYIATCICGYSWAEDFELPDETTEDEDTVDEIVEDEDAAELPDETTEDEDAAELPDESAEETEQP